MSNINDLVGLVCPVQGSADRCAVKPTTSRDGLTIGTLLATPEFSQRSLQMPLETGSTIADLNSSNPAATDGLGQADDHMRLIKAVLKTTFPAFDGVLAASEAQLDAVVSTMFAGTMHSFPKARADIVSGGSATTITGYNFIECDGTTYLIADFPTLAAYLGTTYGGNGTTTFGVPNLKDTGRFIRSRKASGLAVGTSQSNVFKAHTHDTIGNTGVESVGHTHTWGGTFTTGNDSPGHTHTLPGFAAVGGASGGGGVVAASGSATSSGPDNNHTHDVTVSGSTGAISATHTHAISLTSTSTGDATETRPEAFAAIIAIKT